MSSSSGNNDNCIKISLFKAKFLSEDIKEYSIDIDFNGERKSTEKINSKVYTFSPLIYSFPFNNCSNTNINISAFASSWLVLSFKIASISIPLSLNKLNGQRQWYYMKNEKEENLISILVSFSASSITNRYINKTDISINDNINTTHTSVVHSMLNRTVIPRHFSFESSYAISNVFDVLGEKGKKLTEIEEKIKLQKLNNELNSEKIKDREGILKREQRKLDEREKRYKLKQLEYETKRIKLSKNIIKKEKDTERFNIYKDINDYNKDFYANLNFIYISNIDIDRFSYKTLNIKKSNQIPKEKEQFAKKSHVQGNSNPSKKSNSTNITSNTSDLSYNDFSKLHPITHIDLSSITDDFAKSKVTEAIETDPNGKKQIKPRPKVKSANRRNSNISSKSNKQSIISMSSHKSNVNKTIPHGIHSISTVSKFSNRGSKVKKT